MTDRTHVLSLDVVYVVVVVVVSVMFWWLMCELGGGRAGGWVFNYRGRESILHAMWPNTMTGPVFIHSHSCVQRTQTQCCLIKQAHLCPHNERIDNYFTPSTLGGTDARDPDWYAHSVLLLTHVPGKIKFSARNLRLYVAVNVEQFSIRESRRRRAVFMQPLNFNSICNL